MKFNLSIILSLLFLGQTFASAPNWTVNSADFEFSMQVICVAVVDGNEIDQSDDLVGAFVGNQCRGFIQPTYIAAINRNIFYLPVMSNASSGETISFKMYDSQNDRLVDALNTLTFEPNKETGSAQNPYMLSNAVLRNGIEMNTLNFVENVPISTLVANFYTWYNGKKADATYSLPSGVGDNASFEISGNNLISRDLLNAETKSSYSIKVLSVGTSGSFEETFVMELSDVNESPDQITLNKQSVVENSAIGTIVGAFTARDEDRNETFTFSLNEPSDFFMVDGNQLKTKTILNYEEESSYIIHVKVNDSGSNDFVQVFQIAVTDANDSPSDIQIVGDSIAAGLPAGTTIGHLHVEDEDHTDQINLSLPEDELDNALFSIQDQTNLLLSKVSFDVADGASKFIRVKADDGNGGLFYKDLEIVIADKGYSFKSETVTLTFTLSDFVVQNTSLNGSPTVIRIDPLQNRGLLRISSTQFILNYILYGTSGTPLQMGSANAYDFELSCTGLPTGIYYLSIETDKGVISEKLTIQKTN